MTISATEHLYQLRFLGNWDLKIGEQPRPLRSRKAMALLAYLAVENQQPHSRAALVGLLWPEMGEAKARNNLRVVLSRLRKLLGNVVFSNRREVWLDLENGWIDVFAFQQRLAETEQHAHERLATCPHCLDHLQQASAAYRGEFLTGFQVENAPVFDEWLFVQRERLHLQALAALAALAEGEEANGRLSAALNATQRQIGLDPLREAAYRHQMRLHVQQGRRNEALRTYQKCRDMLEKELGVEPEPETEQLYQQILAGELETRREIKPQTAVSTSQRDNLPATTNPFIGRDAELAQLSQRLQADDNRLISLIGLGGAGKSRLALEAAKANRAHFADGVYFVSLASVQRVEGILTAVATALGLYLQKDLPLQEQLIAHFKPRQQLLVIDNLEHLMDGSRYLLAWLQQAPRLTLLVTSRERLNLQAEDLFRLDGLPVPPTDELDQASHYAAVRLFCDRAYRLQKRFKLTASNVAAVVTICRTVDGLPLGLELAATWMGDFSASELAEELVGNLDLLETTQRGIAPHQRSMRAVLTHSWQLLQPAERDMLAKLSIFQGGFSLKAAQKIAGGSLLTLTRLRYKSLLRSAGRRRYDMHELLRQFAAEKLGEELGVETAVYQQHSQHFLQQLADQAEALRGATPHLAAQTLRLDLDNIRQAWQWAVDKKNVAELAQAVSGLARFYRRAGLHREGSQVLAETAQQLGGQSAAAPHLLASLLAEQSHLGVEMGDTTTVVQAATHALALATDDTGLQAYVHTILGWVNRLKGELATARTHLDQALALPTATADDHLAATLFRQLGIVYSYNPETLATAFDFYERGLAAARRAENRFAEQSLLISMAVEAVESRAYEQAIALFEEGLETAVFLQDHTLQCYFNNGNGFTLSSLGMFEKAIEYHQNARQIAHELANAFQESHALHNLCAVQRKLGNLELAERYGREALQVVAGGEMTEAKAYAWLHLGYVFSEQGQLESAMEMFGKALAGWQQLERGTLAVEAEIGLAGVYMAQGEAERALQLIEPHLTAVFAHNLDATDEPIQIALTCYQILATNDDDRTAALLAQTQQWLRETAVGITDPTYRHSFLENIPAHRAVLSL